MSSATPPFPLPQELVPLDLSSHSFRLPQKEIHTAPDVSIFTSSEAYKRITAFINHLNASVSPLAVAALKAATDRPPSPPSPSSSSSPSEQKRFLKPQPPINPHKFATNSPQITISQDVQGIINLITELEAYIKQCPPAEGPRRFGNVAFRTWYKQVETNIASLLTKHLPKRILNIHSPPGKSTATAQGELAPYLLGSFGSAQRLDYGTGHELSFLAFLCGIFVLHGFEPGRDEVALATKVIDAYLNLIRTLVRTYNLEPAGSHGVWGLDDHSFIPYILGSAQLTTQAPVNGTVYERQEGIPHPADVTKSAVVERERNQNLYFGAIGFIYDVKKGPFWEHSPILYDISGIKEGWGKINIGMLKMYNAEVLGKFPVVQHFPFGSIFPWPEEPCKVLPNSARPWAKPGSLPPFESSPILPTITKPRDPVGVSAAAKPEKPLSELKGPVDAKAPWAAAGASHGGNASASGDLSMATTKAPWARR